MASLYADQSKTKDADKEPDELADFWTAEIDRYTRGTADWQKQATSVIKIYLDQHRNQSTGTRRMAILWSNIETLKPAVYARMPVPVVSRRFKDADPIGRKASEILERCIHTSFDLYGVHQVMVLVRDDRLLSARGSAWVRYEPAFEQYDSGDKNEDGEAVMDDRLKSEKVVPEFVHSADFGHTLNRNWDEVRGAWRKVYMTKKQVQKRKFANEEAVKKLTYEVRSEYADKYGGGEKDVSAPQCIIHEIWDKHERQVLWLDKENGAILEEGDPPLNFRNFWPFPIPTYGTCAPNSLIPNTDYRYYQDQAEEIDDLTNKIADLTMWLRMRGLIGVGPSSEGGDALAHLMRIESNLNTSAGSNNVLIPVESWSGFSEKGGMKGLVEWIPVEQVMATLKGAIEARQQLINDVYQITGISDILRGETNPNETLGAQKLKAQTGSRRISTTQNDLARFARDLAELVGEVIAEVFQPETMAAMSGMDLSTELSPDMRLKAEQLKNRMMPPQMQLPSPSMMMGHNGVPPMDEGQPPSPMPPNEFGQQPVLH